jgi:hypothetical protein
MILDGNRVVSTKFTVSFMIHLVLSRAVALAASAWLFAGRCHHEESRDIRARFNAVVASANLAATFFETAYAKQSRKTR